MTYAFTLDASTCSGCKACQEACKDKNGLPAGVLWRKVIEVSGGEWQPSGTAWENSVFAYYLSLSCNHCTHPKCAGVCPTDAFTVRPDGIVLINAWRCMGCGYCAWACPYGAPQFNESLGVMTKCDLCCDSLDAGMLPSCVAACPLRVLNLATIEEMSPTRGNDYLWQLPGAEHPFPLPSFSRTEPHLAIKAHPGMKVALDKAVSNREEILPLRAFEDFKSTAGRHEKPLVAFTLLSQMAVGMALGGLALPALPIPVLITIGGLLALSGLISFLHLGRKRNAWRAISHLKKSWLSREVLLAGLCGLTWLATISWEWRMKTAPTPWPMALMGFGLVWSMAQVYRLRAVPGWNTWRTQASFFLSTIVLGVLGISLFTPLAVWAWICAPALMLELILVLTSQAGFTNMPGKLRVAFLTCAIPGALLAILLSPAFSPWLAVLVLVLALAEEAIGRWQFYAKRLPFPL